MANYSTASSNASDALDASTDGEFVEEYSVGNRRVRRGRAIDQIKAALFLEGLADRRSNGFTRVAKYREPRP